MPSISLAGCPCCGVAQTCCGTELGGEFPPTLTGTITGACCDRLNQSFEMSLSSPAPLVFYEATIGADVCNPIIVKQRVTLRCRENQWVVVGPCVNLDQPATLLS